MAYRIKNTALDHSKRFLHRRAHKMQMEPVLAGRRLRLRSSMTISDELFEHNKSNLELYKGWGVVEWEKLDGEGQAVKEETPTTTVTTPTTSDVPAVYDVKLVDVGPDPIPVVKVIREQTSMNLKEASDLLAMVPVVVATNLDDAVATQLTDALIGAGAKAEKVKMPVIEKAPPHAETAPKETKPQPKSPFKGKKS